MSQVLDDANKTLKAVFATIAGEVERIQSMDAVAARTQQHIDALKRNEADLRKITDQLANGVAAARQKIADAEDSAREIVAKAQTDANAIEADARSLAVQIKQDAEAESQRLREIAKSQVEAIKAEIKDHEARLQDIKSQHAHFVEVIGGLQKRAAEFAAVI